MTKLKNALLILLAAVSVAVGALLPGTVSYLRDRNASGKVTYADMPSLQLSLTHESGLDLYEKLFLLSGELDTLEISAQEARMTAQEVTAAAYAGVRSYLDMGLLGRIPEDYTFSCQPMLVYPAENPKQYIVLWLVEMSLDAGNESWSLAMDDETGKILLLEFVTQYMQWEREELYALSEVITATYLEALALDESEKAIITTWDEVIDEGYYVSKIICAERGDGQTVYMKAEIYGSSLSVYVLPFGDAAPATEVETMP